MEELANLADFLPDTPDGGGVNVSRELSRSLEETSWGTLDGLVYAYGEATRLDVSASQPPCGRSMLSLDGFLFALRAFSSSLVGGVGRPELFDF